MLTRRRQSVVAFCAVFLAVLGVWVSHTLEYIRVAGMDGVREVMVRSIHWYMAPAGLVLALVAAAGAAWGWRAWTALGRQLDAVRLAVAGAWRGAAPSRSTPAEVPALAGRAATSAPLRLGTFWALLVSAQIALYLLQENVEAAAAGVPAPGLGALTGRHWAAVLVHAAIALVLAGVAALLQRAVSRRARAVESAGGLLGVLLAALFSVISWCAGAAVPPARPADRFGRLWCRPPPLLAAG